MNPQLKALLVYAAKNAVNAALLALAPVYEDYKVYNLKTWAGIEHVLSIMGIAVLIREGMIYVPKLLRWSQTANEPQS